MVFAKRLLEATLGQVSADQGRDIMEQSFNQVKGLGALQNFGTQLISAALIILVMIEMYKLITRGQADFLTPIVKVGLALLVLNYLPLVASLAASTVSFVSDKMFNEQLNVLMADAWAATFKGVSDPGVIDAVKMLVSPTAWLCLLTFLGLVSILVIKLLIINVIWPVVLGLIVFSGLISIPIGVMPGMKSFKGWCVNVVEIAVWPIVFQILISLLIGSFQGQIKESGKLADVWKIDQAQQIYAEISKYGDVSDEDKLDYIREETGYDVKIEDIRNKQSMVGIFIRFLAIVAAYGFMCLSVPFLARTVIRSESAGAIGTMVAAGATAAATSGLAWAASRTGKLGVGMSKMAYNSPFVRALTGGANKKSLEEKINERKIGK